MLVSDTWGHSRGQNGLLLPVQPYRVIINKAVTRGLFSQHRTHLYRWGTYWLIQPCASAASGCGLPTRGHLGSTEAALIDETCRQHNNSCKKLQYYSVLLVMFST